MQDAGWAAAREDGALDEGGNGSGSTAQALAGCATLGDARPQDSSVYSATIDQSIDRCLQVPSNKQLTGQHRVGLEEGGGRSLPDCAVIIRSQRMSGLPQALGQRLPADLGQAPLSAGAGRATRGRRPVVAMAAREEAPASAPSPSSAAASPAASPGQNGPARQLERIASIPVVSRADGSGALLPPPPPPPRLLPTEPPPDHARLCTALALPLCRLPGDSAPARYADTAGLAVCGDQQRRRRLWCVCRRCRCVPLTCVGQVVGSPISALVSQHPAPPDAVGDTDLVRISIMSYDSEESSGEAAPATRPWRPKRRPTPAAAHPASACMHCSWHIEQYCYGSRPNGRMHAVLFGARRPALPLPPPRLPRPTRLPPRPSTSLAHPNP